MYFVVVSKDTGVELIFVCKGDINALEHLIFELINNTTTSRDKINLVVAYCLHQKLIFELRPWHLQL